MKFDFYENENFIFIIIFNRKIQKNEMNFSFSFSIKHVKQIVCLYWKESI